MATVYERRCIHSDWVCWNCSEHMTFLLLCWISVNPRKLGRLTQIVNEMGSF